MLGYQDIYHGMRASGEELCLKPLSVKKHESGRVTMTLNTLEESWDTGGQEVQKGEEERVSREWRNGEKQRGKMQLLRSSPAVSPFIYH